MGEKTNYKDTLNLPKTDFPMKGNLPKLEPSIMAKWDALGLELQLCDPKSGRKKFILHDGPPYANGDIHLGHTLNKVLKDIIVRSKTMQGFYSPYVPGWDCHGQPIEHEVEKRLGKERASIDQTEIRSKCRTYALNFVDRQREQFKRLGVFGTWDRPYLTLDPEYEAANVKIFSELFERGLIYKGRKPIHWCYRCKTALAEAEIEYEDEESPSIYIKFPLRGDLEHLQEVDGRASLLVWTTTPWTLPANVAVAVSPDAEYVAVRDGDEILILAEARVDELSALLGRDLERLASFSGARLDGARVGHPTGGADSLVITADFVALDQGTGCVHIAPGHGEDDYLVGKEYGLPAPMPVDDEGKFTAEAGKYAGLHIKKANGVILGDLMAEELLVWSGTIDHSYPHCWRCKSPVIFRATEQWFISMAEGGLREDALDAIDKVNWVPDWSIRRIKGMVAERPDWCISRQRAWGVPIPAFYCEKCGELLASAEVLTHIEQLFRENGADVWFERSADRLLPEGTTCPACSGTNFKKETDIFDVWFESGVSHEAVLTNREELSWPADLYLEGSDQHRGWFQSSLLTSVGVKGAAPYREVLTHGFLVDGDGRKMSKSRGNVVDPLKVIENSGADILRLWVSSADYSSDIAVSSEILDRVKEGYRRIRNTLRFLLGSLADFDPRQDTVAFAEMESIDRWALLELNGLVDKATRAYNAYKFHQVYHGIYHFCSVDLSSFYLDVLKDRLYTFSSGSPERRSAQTAILAIVDALTRLIAPILVFTAEEAWSYLPKSVGAPESVHLAGLPVYDPALVDEELTTDWTRLLELRQETSKALELARSEKKIGGSLEAEVELVVSEAYRAVVNAYESELPAIFIVSSVTVAKDTDDRSAYLSEDIPGVKIVVRQARGQKCARCWNRRLDVGKHAAHPEICGRCIEALPDAVRA